MYRQILVHPDHRKFQMIVWRSHQNHKLSYYQLNTITYGTASAPFLAIRCSKQVGIENENQNHSCSEIIRNDFYMDDLLTGADSIEEAIHISTDLTKILSSAGFHLRKWRSNSTEVLSAILRNYDESKQKTDNNYEIHKNHEVKTLGVL